LASSLGPILAVTVAVPELEAAARAYRSLLGYQELAAGRDGDARWLVLGPADGGWGLVRLLEAPGAARPATFRTLGWAALEILVADADATFERCRQVEGFEVLQSPSGVGGSGALRALQAAGPGGEGVYLTQVVTPSERFDLPTLAAGEHRVYVAVVGTHNLEATRGFFESAFGVRRVTDHPLPVRVLNQAYELPAGSLHRISTVQLARSTVIEIDEYPPAAVPRPPGSAGLTSVTFAGRRPEAGSPRPLPARPEPPYLGAPAWEVSGPFGLRLEVVES
jgi:catechol 2,3-dioxygenase-like lactoylglutathione lyase family enzyme